MVCRLYPTRTCGFRLRTVRKNRAPSGKVSFWKAPVSGTRVLIWTARFTAAVAGALVA